MTVKRCAGATRSRQRRLAAAAPMSHQISLRLAVDSAFSGGGVLGLLTGGSGKTTACMVWVIAGAKPGRVFLRRDDLPVADELELRRRAMRAQVLCTRDELAAMRSMPVHERHFLPRGLEPRIGNPANVGAGVIDDDRLRGGRVRLG